LSEAAHDHALVVGISTYAAAEWLPSLQGPDNDALDVRDWLRQPDGGGLPEENVHMIRSADYGGEIGPQQKAVFDAFTELRELPLNAFGQLAGRRLYVYVAGHGMASDRADAALVTAEATPEDKLHVLVNSWFDWFWYAGLFKEYVLWVDTCATRQPVGLLKPCPWERETSPDRGDLFMAFGAEFGKIAVENPFGETWHGVFTYALLKALNGAVGSPVDSDALRRYLYNNLQTFLTEVQLKDNQVSKEPAFGTTDPMVFVEDAHLTFTVTLVFPAECVGKTATVSTEDGVVAETTLDQAEWKIEDLDAGGYAAYVPEFDRKFGFGVTGGEGVITLH
jgi:hypothetical protein